MCVTHLFACFHTLLSAVLPPPPVSPAPSTHTGAAHTLHVSPPLNEASSCELHNVGQCVGGWCGVCVLCVGRQCVLAFPIANSGPEHASGMVCVVVRMHVCKMVAIVQ